MQAEAKISHSIFRPLFDNCQRKTQVNGPVTLSNYCFIFLEALRKDIKILSEDCRLLGRESNSGPPEYELHREVR
jgi:hypothetical protein